MNKHLIYDSLQTGTDGAMLSVAFLVVVIAICCIYAALFFRRLKTKGYDFKFAQRSTRSIPNRIADHAWLFIACVFFLTVGAVGFLSAGYGKDRKLLRNGEYRTVTGDVSRYVTVWVQPHNRRLAGIAGLENPRRERDQLIVDGWNFELECTRSPENLAGVVGQTGGCVRLKPGSSVAVDYAPIPPTQYRADPLRVWLFD